mgnify:FL=1
MPRNTNRVGENATLELEQYSREQYIQNWKSVYDSRVNESSSDAAKANARREAQRNAVDAAFVACLLRFYPAIDEKTIWSAIGKVHKLHLINLGELGIDENLHQEIYDRCISAHQSWIKASGHSFERFIANLNHPSLVNNGIRFILQSELTALIKADALRNTPEDIRGLQGWGKDFDLYAIQTIFGNTRVFGCIQSKTSIRDRIGRDRAFSENAMDALCWSAAVTLDGDFLNMPEFIHMVNGGGSYPTNSWHGMYAMSGIQEHNDRIYKTNEQLDMFINHAIQAANQFIADRRALNRNWKAE